MKKITILGSTGSIGTQTLDIINLNKDIQVIGLSTYSNIDLLQEQIHQYQPKKVCVMDPNKAIELKNRLHSKTVEVLTGIEGLIQLATLNEINMVVTAIVGMIGILPTIEAIKASKDIALANKETLVTAGNIIMPLAKEKKVSILPVDSEHCAIFQCLKNEKKDSVKRLILTASGGPFRGKSIQELSKVTLQDALNHPNWSMGKKITIDSATLMNKGLEVIEAKWLFDINMDKIDVIIHPQSIVHSMVEYIDDSIIAQMGNPDMKIPIQYALYYPKRKALKKNAPTQTFGFMDLTFEKPDYQTFRCLELAYEALKIEGTMPTVLNASNEYAVKRFLKKEIHFLDIPTTVEYAMNQHTAIQNPTVDDILETEQWTYDLLERR
ncbi:1-deoxy-D-xylulose 5-phosphate reductoisomerase [Natranaerovirga hydrolytica]|uniref:1-deoxy-D-xylulose 5-phosphate reductoisomerase n=1 Tax=Natranaerovirga hydrolytica TaxID=680378 RepID=A0A4R1MZ94_9FIRM|nr:1-deoxy-D-xylulose-5-phosphate reductoisomerase [Natranaerovirga hydrolytica]TCK97930.1 1-deoxy-D-xylulose 5-phosphate reductoisomerase [Natranaerovirga hydrolytica]